MKNTDDLLNECSNKRQVSIAHGANEESGSQDQVAYIFNELFRQLQAAFPASMSTIKDQDQLNEFRRQWMLAFKENGITTMAQVDAGMRQARKQESPYIPSPGKFVAWCKDSTTVLGVGIDDVMEEFRRYNRDKSQYENPEKFPWRHAVMYWVVCDMRRAMYQRCMSELEVEKYALKKLNEWSAKVAKGESVPDPITMIPLKPKESSFQYAEGPEDYKIHYMPNSAMLGSVTPAQWMQWEFERRVAMYKTNMGGL